MEVRQHCYGFCDKLAPHAKEACSVWVIVDLLTKSTHFVPVKLDYSMDRLVELYISEIVRLHGIPLLIVSDRDLRFTLRFWKEL